MKPSEFADRLGEFLSVYLPVTRKVSVNTIRSYRDAFALLLRFLRDQKGIPVEKVSLDNLLPSTLIEWLDHLENARRCSPRSRNQRMSAIRSFLRYLAPTDPARVQQLHRVLAIPSCRCRHDPVPYLEPNLVAALLSQPDLSMPRGRRDAVLLSVLYDTGARSQEIVDLRVRDLRLDSPAQVTLTGKGRKTRIVPLMPSTVRLLRDYLRSTGLDRPGAGSEPVFAGRGGVALTRSGLRSILAKHADAARASHPGLAKRLGPHTLRHTKAMHMLQAGVALIHIRDILGHVDIRTTEAYARSDLEMKRKALEKAAASPSAVLKPNLSSWHVNKDLLDWLTSL
ncbi:MAG TPA: site-specific integrase [Candidatus Limnocylindrales bacterium]|nr:site-specific integrase [Candidatus Limnocylindrales bacterium]